MHVADRPVQVSVGSVRIEQISQVREKGGLDMVVHLLARLDPEELRLLMGVERPGVVVQREEAVLIEFNSLATGCSPRLVEDVGLLLQVDVLVEGVVVEFFVGHAVLGLAVGAVVRQVEELEHFDGELNLVLLENVLHDDDGDVRLEIVDNIQQVFLRHHGLDELARLEPGQFLQELGLLSEEVAQVAVRLVQEGDHRLEGLLESEVTDLRHHEHQHHAPDYTHVELYVVLAQQRRVRLRHALVDGVQEHFDLSHEEGHLLVFLLLELLRAVDEFQKAFQIYCIVLVRVGGDALLDEGVAENFRVFELLEDFLIGQRVHISGVDSLLVYLTEKWVFTSQRCVIDQLPSHERQARGVVRLVLAEESLREGVLAAVLVRAAVLLAAKHHLLEHRGHVLPQMLPLLGSESHSVALLLLFLLRNDPLFDLVALAGTLLLDLVFGEDFERRIVLDLLVLLLEDLGGVLHVGVVVNERRGLVFLFCHLFILVRLFVTHYFVG
mmetsp:Transcript_6557/g.10533  ORF Transcript_6557/g.10533 Transcript_6557/m.10533 type:complete len:496 (+) Transcript_6557:1066-2553(+)